MSVGPLKLIVGLGNPGAEHVADRHNAGFWFVDALCAAHRITLHRETRFLADVGRGRVGDHDVWLMKPQTYMNRSGQAISALARFYRLALPEILVAYDELDLDPGIARIKSGGSSTHNGLRDTTQQLGGPGYWRLRIGIGHPRDLAPGKPVVDYVLGKPRPEHRSDMDDAIQRSLIVAPLLCAGDFTQATQRLHTSAPGRNA